MNSEEVDYIISIHHSRHKQLIDKAFLLILDSFFYNLMKFIEALSSAKVLENQKNFIDLRLYLFP